MMYNLSFNYILYHTSYIKEVDRQMGRQTQKGYHIDKQTGQIDSDRQDGWIDTQSLVERQTETCIDTCMNINIYTEGTWYRSLFWTGFVTPFLGSQCGISPMAEVICKLSFAMPLAMPPTPNPLAGSTFYYAAGQMPPTSKLQILLSETKCY